MLAHKCGLGIVIGDEEDKIMGAKASNFLCFNDPFFAESKAALCALEFALEMGFQNIEVEGDALSNVKQLQDSKTNYST